LLARSSTGVAALVSNSSSLQRSAARGCSAALRHTLRNLQCLPSLCDWARALSVRCRFGSGKDGHNGCPRSPLWPELEMATDGDGRPEAILRSLHQCWNRPVSPVCSRKQTPSGMTLVCQSDHTDRRALWALSRTSPTPWRAYWPLVKAICGYGTVYTVFQEIGKCLKAFTSVVSPCLPASLGKVDASDRKSQSQLMQVPRR
jgi:hypothetical protein